MSQTKRIAGDGAGLTDTPDSATAALLAWGEGAIAYVKQTTVEGDAGYAIHAADGRPLGVVRAERELAFAVVRQNDLEPVSVH